MPSEKFFLVSYFSLLLTLLVVRNEPIADSIHCLDHIFTGGGFEFFSEILDMRIDATIKTGSGAVQVVEQLLARQCLTGTTGEQLQELEFVGREFDGTAVEGQTVFLRVDLQSAYADDAWRFDLALGTTQ